MRRFRDFVARESSTSFADYAALYDFSVKHSEKFWQLLVAFVGLPFMRQPRAILERRSPWRQSRWFPGAQVNWAQMALAARRASDHPAFESFDENGLRASASYRELYRRVRAFRAQLDKLQLAPRDRFAAFLPNTEETLVALLAAVSGGATLSLTSPDFGAAAAADRLSQFAPRFLAAATYYVFKGTRFSVVDKLIEIVRRSGKIEALLIFRAEPAELVRLEMQLPNVKIVPVSAEGVADDEIPFAPYAFEDPLYVMYSSGTTGLPKCIVQGHGVVINHAKEHMLHCGSGPDDRIFYFTTCGWMMYNWLVSALTFGATLVLFDGNPFFPDSTSLWRLACERGITVFGTSARYLMTLAQEKPDVSALTRDSKIRVILSTGSVLPGEGFDYVYESLHKTAQLCSISGGTDLNGCWALGNPDLPVRRGELQCRALGMAVEIWNDEGTSVVGEMGELVCTQPFPSMPLGFLGDENGERYRASYFERFPERDVWAHGDFAALTEEGGMVFGGRSDATLNPGGVRIGTAEIYRVLDLISEIEDALIIGRPITDAHGQNFPHDEQIVLFVKLRAGRLSEALKHQIKKTIRDKVSPRHVPGVIYQVAGVPYTMNGKKVELAVKYIALGRAIANRETIANQEVLAEYEALLAGPVGRLS